MRPGDRRCPHGWDQGAGVDQPTAIGSPPSRWADVLRDLRRRGMRAPMVAVGDGALGFWAALRDVFPETSRQRCWVHKAANVLNALPKSAQPAARRALAEIRDAEDRAHAEAAIGRSRTTIGAKWPKAVAKIVDDTESCSCLLRLPRRALDPPEDDQPDRVDLRHRPAADQGDQGTGLESSRPGHGLQADRGRPGPLAGGQRPAPRRPGPGRARFHNGVLVERRDDTEAAA